MNLFVYIRLYEISKQGRLGMEFIHFLTFCPDTLSFLVPIETVLGCLATRTTFNFSGLFVSIYGSIRKPSTYSRSSKKS